MDCSWSRRPDYGTVAPTTIFGREYVFVDKDEGHDIRNANKAHYSICALGERTGLLVAATATPGIGTVRVSLSLSISLPFSD